MVCRIARWLLCGPMVWTRILVPLR